MSRKCPKFLENDNPYVGYDFNKGRYYALPGASSELVQEITEYYKDTDTPEPEPLPPLTKNRS